MKKILLMAMTMMMIFTMTEHAFASETPLDGNYQVELTFTGGTGRVTAISPTELTVSDGKMTARITLTSSNYTYMIVDGTQYNNTAPAGENSTFIIPISALDTEIKVTACTVAMSAPHEIDYTIKLSSEGIMGNQENGANSNTEGNKEQIGVQNTKGDGMKTQDQDKKTPEKEVQGDPTQEISKEGEGTSLEVASNDAEMKQQGVALPPEDNPVDGAEGAAPEGNAGEGLDDSLKGPLASSISTPVIVGSILALAVIVGTIILKSRKS